MAARRGLGAIVSEPSYEPSYEDVAYSGGAFPAMHPDWLASLAWLHGLPLPEVARARVIEFGCGDGGTLIPLAVALPEARLFGVDLSPAHIARAAALAGDLGLANVTFAVGDLATFDAQGARFDFALAHGVYSWVPDRAREALLALYGAVLTDSGLGYLSFGAYPGGHLDQAIYGMARFHAASAQGGRARIDATRHISRAVLDAVPADDAVWSVLRRRMQQLQTWSDGSIAHDVLSDSNRHVWLHEMAAELDAVGLQHVADAKLVPVIELRSYPKLQALIDLGGDDPLRRAQYLDMARLARFRQIAVARKGAAPATAPLPERMAAVKLRATIAVKGNEVRLARGATATFSTNRGLDFTLDDPLAKAAVLVIAAALPRGLSLGAVTAASAQMLRAAGHEREIGSAPEAHLARVLAELVGYELLLAYTHEPPLAAAPGERPLASPLARWQLARGASAVNLWLETFVMRGPVGRLVPLMDGTRDRASLAAAIDVAPADVDAMVGSLHREGFLLS